MIERCRCYRPTKLQNIVGRLHHTLWILLLFCYIAFAIRCSYTDLDSGEVETYSLWVSLILYCIKLPFLLATPNVLFTILGFLMYNPFHGHVFVDCNIAARTNVFVCFRVVTRGLFPELVQETVYQNVKTCIESGLQHFKIEVVTDREIHLKACNQIREVVVPEKYSTSKGSLFKARALHYCLESGININSGDDWIVHLDEETLLTEKAILGILEFIENGDADIGQGCVTFADGQVVNWFTTLADGIRVAGDYGPLRFSLAFLRRPLVYFKGSYIVVKAATEMHVGFDMDPYSSITEDLYFALKAWKLGYRFGFVRGEMHEKSPFSVSDFVKQRQRWCLGWYHVIRKSDIPSAYKWFLSTTYLSWLSMWCLIINGPLSVLFPIYTPIFVQCLMGVVIGTTPFMYLLGNYIQMRSRYRNEIVRPLALAVWSQPFVVVFGMLECCSVLVLHSRKRLAFDIVDKDCSDTSCVSYTSRRQNCLSKQTLVGLQCL